MGLPHICFCDISRRLNLSCSDIVTYVVLRQTCSRYCSQRSIRPAVAEVAKAMFLQKRTMSSRHVYLVQKPQSRKKATSLD